MGNVRLFTFMCFTFTNSTANANELNLTNPNVFCDTSVLGLVQNTAKHCELGDLIEVFSHEIKNWCLLDTVSAYSVTNGIHKIKLSDERKFLCTYRGARRERRFHEPVELLFQKQNPPILRTTIKGSDEPYNVCSSPKCAANQH